MDVERVLIRLSALEGYLRELEELRSLSLDELLSKPFAYRALERLFQLAIERCIDVANILISSLGWRKPKEGREAMRILGEEGVVPIDFVPTLQGMVGLRNLLVHEYLVVDRRRLYEILRNNLGDFARFAEYVKSFLERSGLNP